MAFGRDNAPYYKIMRYFYAINAIINDRCLFLGVIM